MKRALNFFFYRNNFQVLYRFIFSIFLLDVVFCGLVVAETVAIVIVIEVNICVNFCNGQCHRQEKKVLNNEKKRAEQQKRM